MISTRFITFLSTSCILTILLGSSASVLAKRPKPPPEPDPVPVPVGTTEQVSVASDGTKGNAHSHNQAITPDGRFVAFVSTASNLVPGDTNAKNDIFVHDRTTGITERISVASDGTQADNRSYGASISADGRYVAFDSYASNLVAGEQTYYSQVYVHDRTNSITERISLAIDGSLANQAVYGSAMSPDGRYVVFSSYATNLVSGDTNGYEDVFVRDRLNGTTERVSVASDGSQGNRRSSGESISADGQILTFISDATNLVAGDTNNATDVFVHNRASGTTERVSVASNGAQATGGWSGGTVISANGQVVTFTSTATNLVSGDTNNYVDVFIHDRSSATTERVSVNYDGTQLRDDSFSGSISADGRYVTFLSYAHSLDIGNVDWWYSDIFVYDRVTNTTELISLSSDGVQANEESGAPTISSDGRFVVFESFAPGLVPNGTYRYDVFVRDRNPQ